MHHSPGFNNSQCRFTLPKRSNPSLVTINLGCSFNVAFLFELCHHLQGGNGALVALVAQASAAALLRLQ